MENKDELAKLVFDLDWGIIDCPASVKLAGGMASSEWKAGYILDWVKQAGYFKEEAEWVGKLLKRGWIPPEEAKGYVKLADDQR